jgi:hypothetical protein
MFGMRPSIHVSETHQRSVLQPLHGFRTLVSLVLQLHKDEMEARTEPSIAPQFDRGDTVTLVTKHLFLCGQPSKKLRDRQLGPFIVEEHISISMLWAIEHLQPAFHENKF